MLEQHTHAHVDLDPFLVADPVEIAPEHDDASVLFLVQPQDRSQEDRFARARRADKTEDLSAKDIEIEIVQHDMTAELNVNVAH
ncbi:MAG: hypothetical protein Kow0026_03640 [Oricola sp.]